MGSLGLFSSVLSVFIPTDCRNVELGLSFTSKYLLHTVGILLDK